MVYSMLARCLSIKLISERKRCIHKCKQSWWL